ncbi:MAG: 16S rRNA (adenine(1518)-N(6)/adenine(1519)-N(6))-dimethyltransferase RsmA [candidate division WOR-3 bacterium]
MPRRLGQHFLNSVLVARKISIFAGVENESVLEIGAGKGMLTQELAKGARCVYAVEIDPKYAASLRAKQLANVEVINEDFLKMNLNRYQNLVVVGNIPYSITTKILEKLTKMRNCLKRAILTLQKEYGERLLAQPGSPSYSSITCYINYYFQVIKGFLIKARFFNPPPKVDSIVLALIPHHPPFVLDDEVQFFDFVKGLFRYRRKTLKNALIHHLGTLPDGLNSKLLTQRPEKLSLVQFYELYNKAKTTF